MVPEEEKYSNESSDEEIDRKIAVARVFMRKDRPLPKPGCSWAFFIFLGLFTLGLVVMYFIYRQGNNA